MKRSVHLAVFEILVTTSHTDHDSSRTVHKIAIASYPIKLLSNVLSLTRELPFALLLLHHRYNCNNILCLHILFSLPYPVGRISAQHARARCQGTGPSHHHVWSCGPFLLHVFILHVKWSDIHCATIGQLQAAKAEGLVKLRL